MWKKKLSNLRLLFSRIKRTNFHSPISISHKNTPPLNLLLEFCASFSASFPSPVCEIETERFPAGGGIFNGGLGLRQKNVNFFVKKRNSFSTAAESAGKLKCWNCDAADDLTTPFLVCQACRSVQPANHSIDYFGIFGVERKYNIEVEELEGKYKEWQKKLHPDLVHSKSQRERDYAAEQSARVIDAYRTLTDPLSRAIYLLKLENLVVDGEQRITDPELLAEIMELREAVEEAEGTEALNQMKAQIQEKMKFWSKSFEDAFLSKEYDDAIGSVQRMTYYKRANEEIVKKL